MDFVISATKKSTEGQPPEEIMANFFKSLSSQGKGGGGGGAGGGMGDDESRRMLFMNIALITGGGLAAYWLWSGSGAPEITWKEFVYEYLNGGQVRDAKRFVSFN